MYSLYNTFACFIEGIVSSLIPDLKVTRSAHNYLILRNIVSRKLRAFGRVVNDFRHWF